jgi:hypothetical protein
VPQEWQHRVGHPDYAEDVGVEDGLHLVDVRRARRDADPTANSGVVDEDVEAAEALTYQTSRGIHTGLNSDVEQDRVSGAHDQLKKLISALAAATRSTYRERAPASLSHSDTQCQVRTTSASGARTSFIHPRAPHQGHDLSHADFRIVWEVISG